MPTLTDYGWTVCHKSRRASFTNLGELRKVLVEGEVNHAIAWAAYQGAFMLKNAFIAPAQQAELWDSVR